MPISSSLDALTLTAKSFKDYRDITQEYTDYWIEPSRPWSARWWTGRRPRRSAPGRAAPPGTTDRKSVV